MYAIYTVMAQLLLPPPHIARPSQALSNAMSFHMRVNAVVSPQPMRNVLYIALLKFNYKLLSSFSRRKNISLVSNGNN